jgi:hypothetical protein
MLFLESVFSFFCLFGSPSSVSAAAALLRSNNPSTKALQAPDPTSAPALVSGLQDTNML